MRDYMNLKVGCYSLDLTIIIFQKLRVLLQFFQRAGTVG
jgi:hypothetical protein